MITAALFLVLAGLGALARAEAGRLWNRSDGVPYGILIVNVTGSFLLGLLSNVAPPELTVMGVGGLGAFTTFSSFAHDVVALAERRAVMHAAAYVGASGALGIGVAALGAWLVG